LPHVEFGFGQSRFCIGGFASRSGEIGSGGLDEWLATELSLWQDFVFGSVRAFTRGYRGPHIIPSRYAIGTGEQHIELLRQRWKLRIVRSAN
jgi:hypothetical protein